MVTDLEVCDRVEALYEEVEQIFMEELKDPVGKVLNRVARAELTECEKILAFIEANVDMTLLSEESVGLVLNSIRAGEHRK